MPGQITKAHNKLKNSAIGITPTTDYFDTPPSNISNLTDGNPDTSTGEGTMVKTGEGTCGILILNFGNAKPRLIDLDFEIKSTAGTVTMFVSQSSDGTNFTGINGDAIPSITSTSYARAPFPSVVLNQKYMRILFYLSSAGTFYFTGHEIYAFDLI